MRGLLCGSKKGEPEFLTDKLQGDALTGSDAELSADAVGDGDLALPGQGRSSGRREG